ncbi:hypothetical protein MES4922_290101 [Mesorhizobium ventifaucium]|uniref:Uncharacterized protein n=1 Tax=Mesorhizobium ventifaucium TaxID=666020 RepID=A0ABM9DWP4_9HYPH|nr:hypothetical protein MES4922_290101 [Mesorhizobium ventifaucium]
MADEALACGPPASETVWKLYSGGHLMAFSALPVLTDQRMTPETGFGFRKGSCANAKC